MALRSVTRYHTLSFGTDKLAYSVQRLMNPEGSAYRSETGGLMEALRKLTVEQSE